MTDFEIDFSDITQETELVVGDKLRNELLMCLGNPITKEIPVPITVVGRPGLVYVHKPVGSVLEVSGGNTDNSGEAPEFAVLRPGLIPPQMVTYGTYVNIKKQGLDYIIQGINEKLGNEYFHGFKERIQRPIDMSLLDAGLVWPTVPSSGSVLVTAYPSVLNNIAYWPPILETINLIDTYVPGTTGQAVAVMIESNPATGALTYTASSAFANPKATNDPLTEHRSVFSNYTKTVNSSRFLLAWVKVYAGQETVELRDILHAQEIFGKGGGGGDTVYFCNEPIYWRGKVITYP